MELFPSYRSSEIKNWGKIVEDLSKLACKKLSELLLSLKHLIAKV